MHKIIFIGIIIMALSACEPVPTGTGGTDPETQALLAVATQTGAANLIARTQTAQLATEQSAYAQATAVSYNATATQQASDYATQSAYVQATAVSATETAVYLPVGVQQTTDAQTVLMERENAASTATAVSIQLEMENNRKSAERMDKFWNGFMLFLGGLGFAIVMVLVSMAIRTVRPVPPVYDDAGNVIGMDGRHYLETSQRARRAVVIENQPEPAQIPPPYSTMKNTTDTRTMPGHKNGRPHEWTLPEENPVKDETWTKLAVALLVCNVNFSRDDVLDRTKRNWQYGRMSQPEYNGAYEFMREKGWVGGHMGQDKMTTDLYEFLENYVPSHEEIALPHPDEAEIIEGR